jgi:hypothetical protein
MKSWLPGDHQLNRAHDEEKTTSAMPALED